MPSLPLLRGFSTPAKHVQSVQADSASSSSSTSDTTQQQHGRDQYTHEHLAKQDAAATAILLAGDCDATQAAARRHTTAAGAREPQHLISASSSASSDDSCKLHDALAGQAAAEAAGADLACSGYMDSAVPAASLGVPGARLLLATAVGVGKGTYKFKVRNSWPSIVGSTCLPGCLFVCLLACLPVCLSLCLIVCSADDCLPVTAAY
jgi:hypothetical protein